MARGKQKNKDEVLSALEPYFRLGCNIAKACDYAGIPRTTVQTWVEKDEAVRLKITAWQNEISMAARKVWAKAIAKGDTNKAVEWLSKKERDEFAERKDLTSDDRPLLLTNDEGEDPA